MRFCGYLKKTLIENARDLKILMFAIGFAPCFIFILFLMYGNGQASYQVALIDQDQAAFSAEAVQYIKDSSYEDGKNKYVITMNEPTGQALDKLENKDYDAVAVFQPGFTQAIEQARAGEAYRQNALRLYGDPQNMRYSIAAIYLLSDLEQFVLDKTGYMQPIILDEVLIGKGKALNEFDMYVPKIIVFALLNVMFTAGASLLKEVETGTMQRLVLSPLLSWEFITAISAVQMALCTIAMLLALFTALALGYQMSGSVLAMTVICAVSSFSVMGLALITASFMRTVYDLMTVGVIPYFIVMFFGGILFPLPQLVLAHLGDRAILLTDLLPLSLSVAAFDKVMNFGMGMGDLTYELIGIALVSIAYFCIGLYRFHKTHMRLG